MDMGDTCRAGLRLDVGRFTALDGFAANGFAGRSSLGSESCPDALMPSLSSSSSSLNTVGFLRFGGGGFVVVLRFELSDSVVETRGNVEGRNGLNGGALRFDAA
jgi:hypothetical protein